MALTDREILEHYKSLVAFIATVCGKHCEVVLHDVSKPEESVIAISNSRSGRQIGSPMTELALQMMNDGEYCQKDFAANYRGYGNGKEFVSSTYYIKNEDGKLIGMLCVNNDVSALREVKKACDRLLEEYSQEDAEEDNRVENLESPLESLTNLIINQTIENMHVTPSRMSMEEKIQVVHQLHDQGILRLKGAVSEIAGILEISEPTVYRYLSKKNVSPKTK